MHPVDERIILITLIAFAQLCIADLQSATTLVSWSGGTAHCANSCPKGTTYYDGSFACNSGSSGDWSNGTKLFADPIPTGSTKYMVNRIVLSVSGTFSCNGPTTITFRVGSTIVATKVIDHLDDDCFCPHCIRTITAESPEYDGGWQGYVYSGNNALSVETTSTDICLSFINITIYYTSDGVNPQIWVVLPQSAATKGGTTVSTILNSASTDIAYGCAFIPADSNSPTIIINATLIVSSEQSSLICTSPPIPSPGWYSYAVYIYSIEYIVMPNPPVVFQFFVMPNVTSLSPKQEYCNGSNVITLHGSDFTNITSMRCRYNDQGFGFGTYVNDTTVTCLTPGAGTIGPVQVYFSMNGYEYSSPMTFTCLPSVEPTPTPPSSGIPGWVWVIVVFGGATLGVVALLTLTRRCRKNDEFERGTLTERTTLLSDNLFIKQIDLGDIKLAQKIGKGTFGEVFRGIWNGTEVAVKFLSQPSMDETFLKEFYKEVTIMRSLRHPNVLQFLGACTNFPDVCIVMEYMPLGSLFKILHDEQINLQLEMIKRMMMDAARGMNYLHKSDPLIIHRDLKSHNLLVDDHWKVKVCDFGLSKILQEQADFAAMTACGTPSWTAPEILRNEQYSEKADVYSFAIVLWECLTREDPYAGMPPFQVVFSVGTKNLRPTMDDQLPQAWRDLITDCWAEQPAARPSFDDIMYRLEKL